MQDQATEFIPNELSAIAKQIQLNDSLFVSVLDFGFDDIKLHDTLFFRISGDALYTGKVESLRENLTNTVSVRAVIKDFPAGVFLISKTGDAVGGHLKIPEKDLHFVVRKCAKSQLLYLSKSDHLEYIEPGPAIVPPRN